MLKCKDCEKCWLTQDGEHGVCSLPNSFFPVTLTDDCHYLICPPQHCIDCSHFNNDDACMIAEEDDAICCGFSDKLEDEFMDILFRWFRRNIYSKEKVLKLCEEFELSDEYKFLKPWIEKSQKWFD